jgi:predicted RecB family nuclease
MGAHGWRVIVLSVASLAAALGLLGLAVVCRYARATGFAPAGGAPAVAVIASDTGAATAMIVREPVLGLSGRPDHVIEEGAPNDRLLAPVEVKPSRRSSQLYESDELQLGAYLVALRGTAGLRASGAGYVRYAAATFRVELTPGLERRVRAVVAAVRHGRRVTVVHRSHTVRARCAACPVRDHCEERLA